jgi:hypothetical protein
MSSTNSFKSEVLRHILLNEAIDDLGDSPGVLPSSVDGNLYIALLTQNPGDDGSIVNEASFPGYARVAVPRGSSGWVEANGQVRNVAEITYPACTGGSATILYFGLCKTLTGDDMILYEALPAPALVSIDVELQFDINTLAINLD